MLHRFFRFVTQSLLTFLCILLLGGLLLTGLAGFSVWPYRTTPAADMEQAIAYLAGAGLLLASAWLVRRRQGRRLQHNSLVLDPRLLKKGR